MFLSFDSINLLLEIYPQEIIRITNKVYIWAIYCNIIYNDEKAEIS